MPASVAIGQPISHRLDHLQSGIRAQIVLKIYGQDIEMLRRLAETSRQRLSTIPGLVDLQVEKQVLIPQVRVQVDHARAALHGLTPAAITQALDTLSNGRKVSQIVDGNRRFDVVMRLSEQDRSTTGLHNLLIPTASGICAAERAWPRSSRPMVRTRSSARAPSAGSWSTAMATADATWRDIAADIRRALPELDFPQGYTTNLEGTFQAQEEASWRIGILSLASLAMIFVVLYSRYRSTALALIIMGGIPLALIGSVVALKIAGQPLSVASMIGFITLAGISARNGILKISHYINLAIHEGERFGTGLIVRGSLQRLSPVLMTALCAGLALTPLLFGADEPGREILHPVAVTIFGGLLSATILDTRRDPPPLSDVRQEAAGPAAGRTRRNAHPSGSLLICTAYTTTIEERQMRKYVFLAMIAVDHGHADFAAAQTKKGSNGGPVVTSQGHPIEFVRKGTDIVFYVGDHDGSPLRHKEMRGRATIQDGGKTVTVPLTPASPNMMKGKLQAELSPKAMSCSRRAHGHSLTARYAGE